MDTSEILKVPGISQAIVNDTKLYAKYTYLYCNLIAQNIIILDVYPIVLHVICKVAIILSNNIFSSLSF